MPCCETWNVSEKNGANPRKTFTLPFLREPTTRMPCIYAQNQKTVANKTLHARYPTAATLWWAPLYHPCERRIRIPQRNLRNNSTCLCRTPHNFRVSGVQMFEDDLTKERLYSDNTEFIENFCWVNFSATLTRKFENSPDYNPKTRKLEPWAYSLLPSHDVKKHQHFTFSSYLCNISAPKSCCVSVQSCPCAPIMSP